MQRKGELCALSTHRCHLFPPNSLTEIYPATCGCTFTNGRLSSKGRDSRLHTVPRCKLVKRSRRNYLLSKPLTLLRTYVLYVARWEVIQEHWHWFRSQQHKKPVSYVHWPWASPCTRLFPRVYERSWPTYNTGFRLVTKNTKRPHSQKEVPSGALTRALLACCCRRNHWIRGVVVVDKLDNDVPDTGSTNIVQSS